MQQNQTCPTDSKLRAFVVGSASTDVSKHISQCSKCQSKLDRQQNDEELFQDLVKARNQDNAGPVPNNEFDFAAFSEQLLEKGFELGTEIYSGGQATVYRATQLATKRQVAVKKLDLNEQLSVEQRIRFEREIQVISQLKHPNIVTIFDSGTAANCPYFVMELIDGLPLSKILREQDSSNGINTNQVRKTLEQVREICQAIKHAHQHGVIHRDLKPQNVIVDSHGRPRVLDFGLAKISNESPMELTQTGQILGTLAYASPEQLQFTPDQIDTRTDIYSLGVILFELLTGRLPYRLDDTFSETFNHILNRDPIEPSELNDSIDKDVETIVLKAMSKSPDRRYQTIEQMDRDIELYLNGYPIEARRDSRLYVFRKTIQRNKTLFTAASISLLIILCSLFVSLYFWNTALGERDSARAAATSEKIAKQDAELESNIANIVAAKGAVTIGDVAEAKRRLANVSEPFRDWEWNYWHRRTDESIETIGLHQLYIRDFHIVAGSGRVVSISGEGDLCLWNLADHSLIKRKKVNVAAHSMAISPNNKRIALAAFDSIQILDDSLEELKLNNTGCQVFDLSFQHNGKAVIFCGRDLSNNSFRVVRWDLPEGNLNDLYVDQKEIKSISLHPSQPIIGVAGDNPGTLHLESKQFSKIADPESAHFTSFDPTGRLLLLVCGWKIKVVGSQNRKTISEFSVGGPISHAVFLDKNRIAVSGKGIRLWDYKKSELQRVFHGHDQIVNKTVWLKDDQHLISASKDGLFKKWNLAKSQNPLRLEYHEGPVRQIKFAPRADLIATASEDGKVILFDSSGTIRRILKHDQPVFAVAFSPTQSKLATGCDDGKIRLWDLASGKPVSISAHSDRIHSLDFDSSGKKIVSASRDKTCKVFDISTRKLLTEFNEHSQCVHNAQFDSSGQIVASRCHETIRTWNSENGEQRMSMKQRMGAEDYSLTWIPGKSQLIAGTSIVGFGKGFTTIIDANDGKVLHRLEQHNSPITAVDINPKATRAISASVDAVKIWDLMSHKDIVSLDGIDDPVYSIGFSPDGSKVIAGCRNGTIVIWDSANNK